MDRPFREPGQALWTFPDKVWEEYECDRKELPFFEIEHLELRPKRVRPGDELFNRVAYVLCPSRITGVVSGELLTRILYRGETMKEWKEAYDLKPGRWVLDRTLRVPENKGVGIYAYEIAFESPTLRFSRILTFAVDAPKKKDEPPKPPTP